MEPRVRIDLLAMNCGRDAAWMDERLGLTPRSVSASGWSGTEPRLTRAYRIMDPDARSDDSPDQILSAFLDAHGAELKTTARRVRCELVVSILDKDRSEVAAVELAPETLRKISMAGLSLLILIPAEEVR
jgi:hypothetical protein